MAAVLSTGCAATSVWAEENADVQAETESTDTEENSEAEGEAEEANPEIEEGYTTELDGCTKVVSWCKNGDNNIYGQFYYPADFDENQTYPVVIMSHGIGSTSQMMERAKWPEKAAQDGYVVYTFDFCGGSQNGNSDMDFMDMTVMTEKSDLSAVMDFVKSKDYVDQDHLFLLGQSQGGLVSALTAADRADDVAAKLAELKESDKIGVQQGTTGDIYSTDDFGDDNVERFNKGMEAVQALQQGKIDAVIIDNQPAKTFVEENEGLKILETSYVEEDYALAIKKGNDDLVKKVNDAIKELKEDGTFDKIVAKYITD